jgi:hypothetical protein
MVKKLINIWQLKRAVLVSILLVTVAGCTSTNLGQIDETEDPREDMPGPGVLANEDGETPLKLKTGNSKQPEKPKPVATGAEPLDEKAEFEQFKKWDNLRTNEADSVEYQEFLEWIKYQKFKAGQ